MTPRKKVWLFRFASLAVATCASFALLEIAVRVLLPHYNPLGPEGQTIRQRNPQGDYDLQMSFNRFGFRDSKDLSSATSTDWFAVGDSMGLGWGEAETNRFSN